MILKVLKSALAMFFVTGLASGVFAEIEKSPRTLVHLLEYLAMDYPGAVQNGKVVSEPEYNEQKEFAGYVSETVDALKKTDPRYNPLANKIQQLRKVIESKGDAQKVSSLANEIRAEVLSVSQLAMAPKHWPSLKNGKRLYDANCTVCHGATGHGDGPAGKGLDPAPRDFHDASLMKAMTAFHVFNVTKLGIPGTGMLSFPQLNDEELWDVSFYTLSLRHQNLANQSQSFASAVQGVSLEKVASLSEDELRPEFKTDPDLHLAALRLKDGSDSHISSLPIARAKLNRAVELYAAGDQAAARGEALMAYLEGVEPAEPKLRAADSNLVTDLEIQMSEIRSSIEGRRPLEEIRALVIRVNESLIKAEETLMKQESSPWLSFSLTAGIIFREGFEAILIILAILGVVRAANARRAARFVHAGWISAIVLGIVAWFFSGMIVDMGGANREVTEGAAALFSVLVLLYMGFWMHQRSEIKRWTAFIDGKVKAALEGSRGWTLFALAFVAVFREAFETVLFMRAIYLEGGAGVKTALFSGAVVSISLTVLLGWMLLRFSLKLPIRQLFAVSSWVMLVLAVILVGKGIHSFQEAGMISSSAAPFINSPFFGIFPTYETLVAQLATIALCAGVWIFSNRTQSRSHHKK